MSRLALITWVIEFGAALTIGVILATPNPNLLIVGLIAAAVVGMKVFEYAVLGRERHELIRGQLQVLLALLPKDGAEVRCTYHYPARNLIRRIELVQAFDYIPQGGGGGRRFETKKGIIGKAYEVKGPQVENFQNDNEYREQMLKKYNYSAGELGERRDDRRSYACYPIVDEKNNVLGLIYIDANVPGVFTDDDSNPRWQALNAAVSIVREAVLPA